MTVPYFSKDRPCAICGVIHTPKFRKTTRQSTCAGAACKKAWRLKVDREKLALVAAQRKPVKSIQGEQAAREKRNAKKRRQRYKTRVSSGLDL